MEDLMNMALMFVYPDGTVERIPIGEYDLHVDYMKDHLKDSPRFYQICRGLDFDKSRLHGHIDSVLALNGVAIIFNLDLLNIVKGNFDWEQEIPVLALSFPEKMGSLEQTLALEGIYQTYPKDRLQCDRFDEEQDQYVIGKDFDVEEYFAQAKEMFEARGV